jgi:hypothetical protein
MKIQHTSEYERGYLAGWTSATRTWVAFAGIIGGTVLLIMFILHLLRAL